MALKLTKTGLKDIPIEDLDIIPKEKSQEIDKKIENWNKNPIVKKEGVIAIKKKEYQEEKKKYFNLKVFALIISVLFFILLTISFFWFNSSISKGKLQSLINVTTNVEQPQIPINIDDKDINNYQHNTSVVNNFNFTINLQGQVAQQIADEVKRILKNQTNLTI